MDSSAFDYDLPADRIAQVPVEPRDRARLLVDRGKDAAPEHRTVADLPALLQPGDLVVVNTTRVLPARLLLQKPTGGAVEVFLLERLADGTWEALIRPSRKVAPGTVLDAGDDLAVEVGAHATADSGVRRVRLHTSDEAKALERHGAVPLPPYITAELDDPERYQTVFADRPESVAAPTAGLHLTPEILAGLDVAHVELAVGLGTFKPMTADQVEDHHMHEERYRVPAETLARCEAADRVVAVGTTAVRALESAARRGELEGRTDLFIHRPFDWQVVDVLLTNFHLPRSSLLVLVDAFVGPRWRELYAEALATGYRFLSFGDAMLLTRNA
jgi:S-adenosylmethionine:tRNA ribosyltransferase-isomerase